MVQVGPEQLDRNVGAGARQHGIDAVRDGLSDFHIDTRKQLHLFSYLGLNLLL